MFRAQPTNREQMNNGKLGSKGQTNDLKEPPQQGGYK